jgi:hypothetical protein
MCDNVPPGMMHVAIINSLRAAKRITAAFEEIDKVGALTEKRIAQLGNLRDGTLTAERFSSGEIDRLRELAKSIEPVILGETDTWFVHDELTTSVAPRETATSEQEAALIRLRAELRNLANQLSEVIMIQEAEQLANLIKK